MHIWAILRFSFFFNPLFISSRVHRQTRPLHFIASLINGINRFFKLIDARFNLTAHVT